jgi:photosystem II stability/assembly factor-like uncharacterized protein
LGHTTDNPKSLHLYSVRRVGEDLYIAGEQGVLLKLDRNSGRFVAQQIPYQGTLFGLVGNEKAVLAHGMRGNVVRSTDGGRSWTSVSTPVQAGLTASTLDERGRIVIVSQAGHVLMSADDGASFAMIKVERPTPASAVVSTGAGGLVVAGPARRSLHATCLKDETPPKRLRRSGPAKPVPRLSAWTVRVEQRRR